MVDEIHAYYVHVLQDKLGGVDDGRSQMAHGSGHVLIRFDKDGETLACGKCEARCWLICTWGTWT